MNYIRARLFSAVRSEHGMTLIEVIVAMSLLAVLATASLGVYISGINASTAHQRREIAVTIASQKLEAITNVPASSLYSGRTAAAVDAVRLANNSVLGANQMYRVVSTVTGTAIVPTTEPVPQQSGTSYTINTLIGTCFQKKIGGDCTATAGSPPTQPATPSNMTVLSRVIVIVRWTAGSGCKPVACSYQTSTLIDSHGDLTWNSHD